MYQQKSKTEMSREFLWDLSWDLIQVNGIYLLVVLLCYFCINMINMFAPSKDFKTWNLIEIIKDHVPRRYVASSPRKQISERMVNGCPVGYLELSTPLIHVGNGDVQHGFWIVWPICCNHASYFRQIFPGEMIIAAGFDFPWLLVFGWWQSKRGFAIEQGL